MIYFTQIVIWCVAIGMTVAFYFLWKKIKVYEKRLDDLEEKLNYESAAITRLNDTMDSKIDEAVNSKMSISDIFKEGWTWTEGTEGPAKVKTVFLRKRKGKK